MNDDGDHVAGVTGALKSIGFAIKQVRPTRVIVVFDGKGGSNSRKKIHPEYKGTRKNNKLRVNRSYNDMMNEEDERESMKRQIAWLGDVLHVLPVTTMMYDGVEADDVMAYVATHLLGDDEQGVLMSTDKDFLQLVDDTTIVWSPTMKKIYNMKSVKERFGIESKNLLLYRVLDGDISDNIPGIKGCGLKTIHKRFPELTENDQLTIDDLLRLARVKQDLLLIGKKKPLKLYTDIINSESQIRMNEQIMQLYDPMITGIVKMDILTRFDEPVKPISKIEFLKVCNKYKIIGHFGKDFNSWLRDTFSTLIVD